MKKSTWKITALEDGRAVASVEGVSHEHAVAAIRNAMYGRDPLADLGTATVAVSEETEGLPVAA